eukprot:CAMPEP_0201545964 /NCGR_PEP_ID=MMETSP0173_2-20130828/2359_1 /ASSEMBLY_ACC=CAM_ASM_000268 /TAXON_ID=218659 /ORGANISM="Vexillifera sp., Strain DIVA3 564/2" /LENGTH=254 /DNA_ID=CAMNT_0047954517 /DNA_START=68 /DNA_END=832 /DNA_ORIENTATION=+
MNKAWQYGMRATWIQETTVTADLVERPTFLGVGNLFFPTSRISVGIHVMNLLAKRLNVPEDEWELKRDGENWIEVYQSDQYQLVRGGKYDNQTESDILTSNVHVFSYDPHLLLGEYSSPDGVQPFPSVLGGRRFDASLSDEEVADLIIKERGYDPSAPNVTSSSNTDQPSESSNVDQQPKSAENFSYKIGVLTPSAAQPHIRLSENIINSGFRLPRTFSTENLHFLNKFHPSEQELVDVVAHAVIDDLLERGFA